MHRNSFDLLRLIFATLVIVSHCWGLLGLADPLEALTHTANLGEVAVCGFFVISGKLISESWRRSPGIEFFRNRILRIVPAFAVAFLICVVVVGAVANPNPAAYWAAINWPDEAFRLITLHGPSYFPRAFEGLAQPYLNGPLWTIRLEFVCYVLTPLLVWRRSVALAAWCACLTIAALLPDAGMTGAICFPRLLAMFLSGALLSELEQDRRRLILSAIVLVGTLPFPNLWEIGLATGGAYLTLAAGRLKTSLRWPDVSYGTYLYGWPIQNLLIYSGVGSPLLLLALAAPLAWLAGLASWFGVERMALRLKRVSLRPVQAAARLRTI